MANIGRKKAARRAAIMNNAATLRSAQTGNVSNARMQARLANKSVRRSNTAANVQRASMPLFPQKTINQAPGRRNLSAAARRGKKTAAIVAAGALGVNAIMSNSGRATDRTVGRPTGIFGY